MRRVVLLAASTAVCFAAPDAGTILQDIEKQHTKPSQKQSAPSIKQQAQPRASSEAGVKILVKSFKLSGNTLVTTQELQGALSAFAGKGLDFNELQSAATAIADYYRQKGYTARAFLPPQEVTDGAVEIVILEGKLSGIEIESQASKRLKPYIARRTIESSQPVGEVLSMAKLERGVLLVNDNPGIVATSSLEAGDSAGDSVLKLKIQDSTYIDSSLIVTNTGSRSTGTNQVSLSSGINSPLSIGDQIVLQGMATKGIRYAKVGYSLPVGYDGIRMGANASKMEYRLVDSFASLNSDGTAATVGMNASYAITRSRTTNTALNITLDKKEYKNYSNNTETSNKKVTVANASITYTNYTQAGQWQASAGLTRGVLDLSANATDLASDRTAAQTNGNYEKLSYGITNYQTIAPSLDMTISITGQQALHNLDSSEKLYLGGSSAVRAYPGSEAGGDSGYITSIEFRYSMGNSYIAPFYDYGRITQHYKLYSGWQGTSDTPNGYSLSGKGVSVGYSKGSLSLKATLAWRDGNNPNMQSNGTDNDGTKDTPRLWLQLVKGF